MKKMTPAQIVLLCCGLSGCGTLWKTTPPSRTSLDQILVSTAAERAAYLLPSSYQKQVNANLPLNLGKCFILAKNFVSSDEQYALQAIRNSFLSVGVVLVDEVSKADTIIEVASGALSVDNTSSLVGIPAMAIPIPLAGNVQIPEIPLYKTVTNRGLAKFAIGLYDARTGKVKGTPFTTIGTAMVDSWEVLLFFKFMDNDLQLPNQYESNAFIKH
jgi:hypothetical protein